MPLRPRYRDLHHVHVDADFEFPLHQHMRYYEVVLARHTPYSCTVNGGEVVLQPDQLLVIQPGDWHQDHFRKGDRHLVLHFEFYDDAVNAFTLFARDIPSTLQVCREPFTDEAAWLETLVEEAEGNAAHAAEVQDCLVEALLWRIVRKLPVEALSPRFQQHTAGQDFCRRLGRIFRAAEQRDLSVEEMAQAMHLSRRQLTELCTRWMGAPPARAFDEHKIRQARRLLLNTPMLVKDVSFRLGFKNPYHFSRVFKRHTGLSPAQMRQGGDDTMVRWS